MGLGGFYSWERVGLGFVSGVVLPIWSCLLVFELLINYYKSIAIIIIRTPIYI